uniref:Uncharacterized protein n=1 Tax=Oryza punctata TaxID=4537 RepID=A0A0E0LYL1_ORYPU
MSRPGADGLGELGAGPRHGGRGMGRRNGGPRGRPGGAACGTQRPRGKPGFLGRKSAGSRATGQSTGGQVSESRASLDCSDPARYHPRGGLLEDDDHCSLADARGLEHTTVPRELGSRTPGEGGRLPLLDGTAQALVTRCNFLRNTIGLHHAVNKMLGDELTASAARLRKVLERCRLPLPDTRNLSSEPLTQSVGEVGRIASVLEELP